MTSDCNMQGCCVSPSLQTRWLPDQSLTRSPETPSQKMKVANSELTLKDSEESVLIYQHISPSSIRNVIYIIYLSCILKYTYKVYISYLRI